MIAKITAPDLPQDVIGAELLIERHKDRKVEIDARSDSFKLFIATGYHLINESHILSQDIEDKIRILKQRMSFLITTWERRSVIYDQNLDVQLFKREANLLENWLVVRESTLRDGKVGESIIQVEDLIRKHEDFEKTITSQEEKFEALKRITLVRLLNIKIKTLNELSLFKVEEAFAQQLLQEKQAREAERERLEQERFAQRKQQEMQRITELRRQESYRERPGELTNGNSTFTQENEENPSGLPTNLTKSNSVAHMFGDRIRRGQDPIVKRAESMKVPPSKPIKKTPSFTTRRRGSFRTKNAGSPDVPPVEAESFLDRKQVTFGGKRAANRTWKNVYTVMCGQLLCFFKNKEDFVRSNAFCAPIAIHNCQCGIADDYNKRKHTFRLITSDSCEYLFSCNSEQEMQDWISKIVFRARLPPSQQLVHYDVPKVLLFMY